MKHVFDYCEEYLLSLTSTWFDFPKKITMLFEGIFDFE